MNFTYNQILKSLIGVVFTLCSLSVIAQSAYEGIRYQAILRDASGSIVSSKQVDMRFTIYQFGDLGNGYVETHSVSTNVMGLINLTIGSKDKPRFGSIDWGKNPSNPFLLKVEFSDNGGATFLTFGESQLMSVPYAMYAKNVENADDADADPANEIQDLQLTGNILEITNNGTPTLIDLTKYLDNTDAQVLSYNPADDTLKLTNGGSVYLGVFAITNSLNARIVNDSIRLNAVVSNVSSMDTRITNDSIRLNGFESTTNTRIVNDSLRANSIESRVVADSIRMNLANADIAELKLGAYKDSSSTNELQNLTLTTDSIQISNGRGVPIRGFADTNRVASLEKLVNDTSNYIVNRLNNLHDSAATNYRAIDTNQQAIIDTATSLRNYIDSRPAKGIDSVLANGNDANEQLLNNLGELRIGTITGEGNMVTIVDSNNATSGYENGLKVRSQGTNTANAFQSAVFGEINGTNGQNIAVDGTSQGNSTGKNTGVGGYARNADFNQAVEAVADSGRIVLGVQATASKGKSQTIGVIGTATDGDTLNIGVAGEAARGGVTNSGVRGFATAGTLQNIGVEGRVNDNSTTAGNRGVFGWTISTGAWNEGVSGFSTGSSSNSNTGVYGLGQNSTGVNRGIQGSAMTPTSGVNIGTEGNGGFGTSQTMGVRGTASGNSSSFLVYGVYGQADSSGTIKRGVVGNLRGNADANDAAVYGIAEGRGTNTAVYGRANNTNNSADTNIALVGQAANALVNISGWFKEGNVIIDDTLFLANGVTQNYVLTATGNDGRAEWRPAQSDNDADSTNEIITSFTLTGDTLRITEAGVTNSVVFNRFVDTTTFNNYKTQIAQQFQAIDTRIANDSLRLNGVESNVSGLSTRIVNDSNRLVGVESGLNARITNDSTRLNGIAAGIDTRIVNDSIRLNGVDADITGLDTRVSNDSTRLNGIETALDTRITNDSVRLNGVESGLDTRIVNDSIRMNGIDVDITGLDTRVGNDSTRLNGIETALDTRITNDSSRLNGVETGLDTRIENDSLRLNGVVTDIIAGAYKDSSATNELQELIMASDTSYYVLKDVAGNTDTVFLPAGQVNLDNDATNEYIDSLYLNGTELISSQANGSNKDTVDLAQFDQSVDITNLRNDLKDAQDSLGVAYDSLNLLGKRIDTANSNLTDTAAALRSAMLSAAATKGLDSVLAAGDDANEEGIYNLSQVGIGVLSSDYSLELDVEDSAAVVVTMDAGSKLDGTAEGLNIDVSGGGGSLESHGIVVKNTSNGDESVGLEAEASGASFENIGVESYAQSSSLSSAAAFSGFADGNGDNTVFEGFVTSASSSDGFGLLVGASGAGTNYGVYSRAVGGDENWAGYFDSGNVYIGDTLYYPLAPVNGYVLTVDGNGRATWQPAASTYTTKGIDSVLAVGSDAAGDSILNLGALRIGASTGQQSSLSVNGSAPFSIDVLNNSGTGTERKAVFGVVSGANTAKNFGIYGSADGSTDENFGLWGKANADNGSIKYGVRGEATGSAGQKRGVYGTASGGVASGNYAGYFDQGKVYIANNLGIGNPNPARRLDIGGDLLVDSAFTNRLSIGQTSNFLSQFQIDSTFHFQSLDLGSVYNVIGSNARLTSGGSAIATKTGQSAILYFTEGEIALNTYKNAPAGTAGAAGSSIIMDTNTIEFFGQLKYNEGTSLNGKVLTSDANGNASWQNAPAGADNLGNHTATQNVELNGNFLSNDGDSEGLRIDNASNATLTGGLSVNDNQSATGYALSLRPAGTSRLLEFKNSSNSGKFDINIVGTRLDFNETNVGPTLVFEAGQKVGIATTTIDSTLTVDGGIKTTYFTMTDGTSLNGKVLTSDASGRASWQTPAAGGDTLGNHMMTQNLQTGGNFISNDGDAEGIHIAPNGNVTIGASTGFDNFAVRTVTGDVEVGITAQSGSTELGFAAFGTSRKNKISAFRARGAWLSSTSVAAGDNIFELEVAAYNGASSTPGEAIAVDVQSVSGSDVSTRMDFSTFDTDGINRKRLSITETGNIGIGTTSPDSTLTVDGGIKTTYFTMTDGTSLNGKVLTSDASGRASWQTLVDTLTCPALMEKVNGNYCIHKAEQPTATWFVADSICVDAGYELASYNDWYGAATQAAAGNITLTNMENNWEWTSNVSQNNMLVVGDGSGGGVIGRRQRAYRDPEANSAPYRCVYRK